MADAVPPAVAPVEMKRERHKWATAMPLVATATEAEQPHVDTAPTATIASPQKPSAEVLAPELQAEVPLSVEEAPQVADGNHATTSGLSILPENEVPEKFNVVADENKGEIDAPEISTPTQRATTLPPTLSTAESTSATSPTTISETEPNVDITAPVPQQIEDTNILLDLENGLQAVKTRPLVAVPMHSQSSGHKSPTWRHGKARVMGKDWRRGPVLTPDIKTVAVEAPHHKHMGSLFPDPHPEGHSSTNALKSRVVGRSTHAKVVTAPITNDLLSVDEGLAPSAAAIDDAIDHLDTTEAIGVIKYLFTRSATQEEDSAPIGEPSTVLPPSEAKPAKHEETAQVLVEMSEGREASTKNTVAVGPGRHQKTVPTQQAHKWRAN